MQPSRKGTSPSNTINMTMNRLSQSPYNINNMKYLNQLNNNNNNLNNSIPQQEVNLLYLLYLSLKYFI